MIDSDNKRNKNVKYYCENGRISKEKKKVKKKRERKMK